MTLAKKLSSSSSSNSEHPDLKEDETCGFEIGCGSYRSGRFPVLFCQSFATSRWALVFFSFGAIVQGFLVNGHTSVVISTLERRFELSSTESGLISSCYDIAGSITVLFVTYVGGHGHKPLWIGWGIFLVGLSGIIFSLPHFLAPTYTFMNIGDLCGEGATESCEFSTLKNFRFVFYAALLLAGVGASPLYSIGVTFLDENVKQRYSSFYNGILISMSIVGPGIGYLVGGALLWIYTYPEENVSIDLSSRNWVGAWWIGALVIGIIGIIVAVPTLMLPRVIPGTEKYRSGRGKEMHKSAMKKENQDPVFGERIKDFPKVLLHLFRNPTYVFECFGAALDSLLVGGLAVFGPKYLETQFGIDASDAGTYFGILAIIGGAGGQLIGSGVISKFNLNIKWMMHICYIAPIIAGITATSYFLNCSNLQMAGVSVRYHNDTPTNDIQLISNCNSECACIKGLYSPVCGRDGISYFSPCHAGCSDERDGVYINCTCIGANGGGLSTNETPLASATRGFCVDDACRLNWRFILFCFMQFIIMFLTFFNEAAVLQVSLRCVSFKMRSFAVGVQILIWRVLGTIPGPLVVGAIFDSSCIQWTEECGTRGSCIAYDSEKLSLSVFLFVAIVKAADVLIFVAAFLTYKPVKGALPSGDEFIEDNEDSENNNTNQNLSIKSLNEEDITTLPGEILSVDKVTSNGDYVNKTFSVEDSI